MKKVLFPVLVLLLCVCTTLIFLLPGNAGDISGKNSTTDKSGNNQEETIPVMYASRDVNLRGGAGVDHAVLSVILRGEAVTVYSLGKDWSKVIYKDAVGYVKTSLLSDAKPPSYEALAQDILDTMTMEEKVGQMFFVRCRKDTASEDLQKYHLGGYILFNDDIKGQTTESLKSKIQGYQDVSNIPLLIGVDEEGGDIVRISKYTEFRAVPFHSPQALYTEGGFQLIAADTKEKAILLKSLGFNVNLAPVCDISADPNNYIYTRTFGKDAAQTAEYVKTVVTAMNTNGIGCALKHFPGYGRNADTHKGIAVDERSYESFRDSDFVPFRAGIDAGAGSVLVSHNIVKCMDASLPASLSPAVHVILREELGFQGVIMTDDLKMDAIKEYIGDEVSAVLAIKAGNDLILASDFDVQIPSVIAAVQNGNIKEVRLNESVLRILEWKLRLGIIPESGAS
jgi:beta-N-acetylhexosaminidase